MTENASEFCSRDFSPALTDVEAKHIYIGAGRPQSNGCVERVQQTLLEECWKPAFARYLIPKYTGLQRDLIQELRLYNTNRIHQGRRIRGMTPEQAIDNRKLWISNPQ
jgi:transposase InsO family protein